MKAGFPLLAALVRSRLIIFRNLTHITPWPALLGAALLVGVFPLFWAIIGAILFRDPDFLFGAIRGMGLAGLNRIALGLLQTGFLVVVVVGVQEEIASLFRERETEFLLDHPHPASALFAWRLGLSSLRILVTSTIGLPILLVYLLYFWRLLAVLPFALASVLLLGLVALSAVFLGALIQLLAGALAFLLLRVSRFRLICGGLVAYAVAAWQTLQPMVGQIGQGNLFEAGHALVGAPVGWWETMWLWLPPARFLAVLEIVDHGEPLRAVAALTSGLAGLVGGVWLSGVVVRTFCLDDAGSMRERAKTMVATTGSVGYGSFLARLPALERGWLFEEWIFFRRRFQFQFWLVIVATTLAPLAFPTAKLLSLVTGSEAVFLVSHGVLGLILLLDLVSADFTVKPCLIPLLVTLPIDLHGFFVSKARIHAGITLVLLLAIYGVWASILPLSGTIRWLAPAACPLLAFAFSWTVRGLYAVGLAMLASPAASGSETVHSETLGMVTIAVTSGLGIILIGIVQQGLPGLALLFLVGWFLSARLLFIAGVDRFIAAIR